MVATISPTTLADLRRRGEKVTLIDVRTPAEFGELHVDFAHNIPLERLDARDVASLAGDGPVYLVCRSGTRSRMACERLLAAGVTQVASVEGGTTACEAAGVPVVRGRKAMSLERQVRIAAGSLVAVGAAVAAFAPDPLWQRVGVGLAGFIGCGLVFAGVTDTCGMALVLARMPWNQVRGGAASCARAVLVGLVVAGLAGAVRAEEHTKDSLDVVRKAVSADTAVLVDVREPDEWEEGHVVGARLLPLSVLEKGVTPADLGALLPEGKVVYCHCRAGGRCLEAAAILRPLGYDVRPLKPGYPDLQRAGFPTATGK